MKQRVASVADGPLYTLIHSKLTFYYDAPLGEGMNVGFSFELRTCDAQATRPLLRDAAQPCELLGGGNC